ncbi:MAG: HD domain-containing protein [Candidatus Gracilibacteria bacterium]
MIYSALRSEVLELRPDLDIGLLDKAYAFAEKAHKGQKRYSGEPYIIHPVEVAHILLTLNPDVAAMQAALLHDVTEDTSVKLAEIEKNFGTEVAGLVKGMEKLAVVKLRTEDPQEEKWRKMFLAMARDIRIVFIKLADRLHNMRTLHHVPLQKQQRIARETLGVHAAIASHLGIYQIKSELEDLCFQYLYPEDHKELSGKLASYRERSEGCMAFATSQLEQLLVREGMEEIQVQGRMKHLWSIYQKLQKKDVRNLEAIYDLFAVRVILPDNFDGDKEDYAHLYSVLGLLHGEYLPLQDRFKDYIAAPKANGYRSLHSTMLGLGGDLYDEPTEVQIRTRSMHKEAEIGIASHWSYKLGKKGKGKTHVKLQQGLQRALQKVHALLERGPDLEPCVREWVERFQYLAAEDRKQVEKLLLENGFKETDLDAIRKSRGQQVLSLQPNIDEQLAWLRGLAAPSPQPEINLYPDRIFVLTPNKKVIELQTGSNPIDFAYAVHTEVGNKMVNAKVNGRIVPFDYELQNGEVVEIVTRSNARPNRYWSSLAKTSSARGKIKNWFNKQDKEGNTAAGREMVNKELQALGKAPLDDKLSLFKNYGGKSRKLPEREQLLENVGLGNVSPFQLVKTLFPNETAQEKKSGEIVIPTEYMEEVLVTGEENLPVVLSACCKPRPPCLIVGYVTRDQFIRIHKKNCRELADLDEARFVSSHWKTKVGNGMSVIQRGRQ